MFKIAVVVLSVLALGLGHQNYGFGSIKSLPSRLLPGLKIVGGENADLGEFPHQVSLQLKGLLNGHYCGGSIVAPNVIITAGHCITEVSIPILTHVEVVAGIVSLKNEGQYVQKSKVKSSTVHPSYNGGVNPNDIAIHVLETPFEFNEYVNAIALPNANEEPTGTVTLSGWGSTSNTNNPIMPDHLQKVDLPIVGFSDCDSWLGESPLNQTSNICTGPLDGTLSACSGDSGGPLISTANGKPTLVGVVSWGEIPCGKGAPSVFTKVSSFRDFIDKIVSENS